MAGFNTNSDDELVSAINVTPLVDVVLVLLIIFMITAPVIYQNAIKVQLPQAKTGEQAGKQNPLSFVLNKDGDVYLSGEKITWENIPTKLKAVSAQDLQNGAQISADKTTPHGTVVRLMDILRQANVLKLSLTVESNR